MRTFSFILAFAFMFAGPSISLQADSGLPGAGAFSYGGPAAPMAIDLNQDLAHLTLTRRTRG